MKKRCYKIKLISIATILLLFLIPLISSPVTAAVLFNAGSGTSTNTNPPPLCTVAITMTGWTTVGPSSTPPLTVSFSYTFIDANNGPMDSNHICTMTVTDVATAVFTTVSTGWVFVASGGLISGTLTTPPITFSPPPPNIVFRIDVTMQVADLNAPPRGMTGAASTRLTVT